MKRSLIKLFSLILVVLMLSPMLVACFEEKNDRKETESTEKSDGNTEESKDPEGDKEDEKPPVELTAEELLRALKEAGVDMTKLKVLANLSGNAGVSYLSGEKSQSDFEYIFDPETLANYGVDVSATVKRLLSDVVLGAEDGENAYSSADEIMAVLLGAFDEALEDSIAKFGGMENYIKYLSAFSSLYNAFNLDSESENIGNEVDAIRTLAKTVATGEANIDEIIISFEVLGEIEENADFLTFAKNYKDAVKSFSLNYQEKDNYNTSVVIPSVFRALETAFGFDGEEARLALDMLTYPGGAGEKSDLEEMAKGVLIAALIPEISESVVDSVPPYSDGGSFYILYEKDGKYYREYDGLSEFEVEDGWTLITEDFVSGYYTYVSIGENNGYFAFLGYDPDEAKTEADGADIYVMRWATVYEYSETERQNKIKDVSDILLKTVCEALYDGKTDFAYFIACAADVSKTLGADEKAAKLASDLANLLVSVVSLDEADKTEFLPALSEIVSDNENAAYIDSFFSDGFADNIANLFDFIYENGDPFEDGSPDTVSEFLSDLGLVLSALDVFSDGVNPGELLSAAALAVGSYGDEIKVTVDDVLYELIKIIFDDDARELYGSVKNYITAKTLALVVPVIAEIIAENTIEPEVISLNVSYPSYISVPYSFAEVYDVSGNKLSEYVSDFYRSDYNEYVENSDGTFMQIPDDVWYLYETAEKVTVTDDFESEYEAYFKLCSLYKKDGTQVFADDIMDIARNYDDAYYNSENDEKFYCLPGGGAVYLADSITYHFVNYSGDEETLELDVVPSKNLVLCDDDYMDFIVDENGSEISPELADGETFSVSYVNVYSYDRYLIGEDGSFTENYRFGNYCKVEISIDIFKDEDYVGSDTMEGYIKLFDYTLTTGEVFNYLPSENYSVGSTSEERLLYIGPYSFYGYYNLDLLTDVSSECEAFATGLTGQFLALADLYLTGGDKEEMAEYISGLIGMFDKDGKFDENLALFKKNVTENSPEQYSDLLTDVMIPSLVAAFPEIFGEVTEVSGESLSLYDELCFVLENYAGLDGETAKTLVRPFEPDATDEDIENALYTALSLVKYEENDLTGLMAIYDFFKDYDPSETVTPETVTRILGVIDDSFDGEMNKLFAEEETQSFGEAIGRVITKIFAILARAAHMTGDYIVMEDADFIEKYDITDRLGNTLMNILCEVMFERDPGEFPDAFGEAFALLLFDKEEYAGWAASEFGEENVENAEKAGNILGEIIGKLYSGEEVDIPAKFAEFISVVDPENSGIFELYQSGDDGYVSELIKYVTDAFGYLITDYFGIDECVLYAIADFDNIADYKEELLDDAGRYAEEDFMGTLCRILSAYGYLISDEIGDVDASDLLSFIPVPDGITVDYDLLLDSLRNSTDPEDLISIDFASELTPEAENGALTSVTLTLKAVFGAEIVSLIDADAELTLSVIIEF